MKPKYWRLRASTGNACNLSVWTGSYIYLAFWHFFVYIFAAFLWQFHSQCHPISRFSVRRRDRRVYRFAKVGVICVKDECGFNNFLGFDVLVVGTRIYLFQVKRPSDSCQWWFAIAFDFVSQRQPADWWRFLSVAISKVSPPYQRCVLAHSLAVQLVLPWWGCRWRAISFVPSICPWECLKFWFSLIVLFSLSCNSLHVVADDKNIFLIKFHDSTLEKRLSVVEVSFPELI